MFYVPPTSFPHGAPVPVKTKKMSANQTALTPTRSDFLCFCEQKQKHVESGDDKGLKTGNFFFLNTAKDFHKFQKK